MEKPKDKRIVGSYEAKTHLPRLLEYVAEGEQITITRHGAPIAKIVPMGNVNRENVKKAVKELLEFSKGRTLGALSIREMIHQGRK